MWNFTSNLDMPSYDSHVSFDSYIESFDTMPDIVIYGAGNLGESTVRAIKGSKRYKSKLRFVVDKNYKSINSVEDVEVKSPNELKKLNNYVVIIAVFSKEMIFEIYQNLICMGIDRNRIFIPPHGFLRGYCKKQYFDVVKPKDDEVFIDAGFYNGGSSIEFFKWCGGKYKHIYALEPYEYWANYGEQRIKEAGIKNFTVINAAAYDCNKKIKFLQAQGGESRISDEGNVEVDAVSIDSVLKGEKATFIKMDLEGGEKRALMGARDTIRNYSPVLAIAIYHNWDDFVVLPYVILQMNSKYKFYIRHYSSFSSETVLYAVIEGRDEIIK